ncbi:hypothetical protein ABZP36_009819 [Zizania latifolia]
MVVPTELFHYASHYRENGLGFLPPRLRNVPHSWTQDDFKRAVEEVGPGVLKADLMIIKPLPHRFFQASDKQRYFILVDFLYHDILSEFDVLCFQIKSVYVKNLPKNVTQAQLKKLFEHHGEITKVVLPPSRAGHDNKYGFVHFKERFMVTKALQNTEGYELDGQVLDCSLAKPPSADKKDDTVSLPSSKGVPLLPTWPMLYAPRAPPGAAMLPMVLPDGRLVYVVQQPGGQLPLASPLPQQAGRHGGSGSSSRPGAKRHRGDDNSSSRSKGRRRPY